MCHAVRNTSQAFLRYLEMQWQVCIISKLVQKSSWMCGDGSVCSAALMSFVCDVSVFQRF